MWVDQLLKPLAVIICHDYETGKCIKQASGSKNDLISMFVKIYCIAKSALQISHSKFFGINMEFVPPLLL
jgi:hypothetical protein